MANWLGNWYGTSSNNTSGTSGVTVFNVSSGISASELATATAQIPMKTATEAVPIAMPSPNPLTLDEEFDRLELEEHAALCKELGVWSDSTKKLSEADLRRYLYAKGIQVYDFMSVETYLKSIASKNNNIHSSFHETIVWLPLRVSDLKLQSSIGGQRYAKPVPIHILQLVKEMEAEKPGELYFSVSDYKAVKPDPFLAITTRIFSPWPALVIAHWDEPAYKVKLEK